MSIADESAFSGDARDDLRRVNPQTSMDSDPYVEDFLGEAPEEEPVDANKDPDVVGFGKEISSTVE